MPCYKRDGVVAMAFASQKQYIAIYCGKAALDEFGSALGASSMGKGCVRFRSPEQMDFEVIERLLRRAGEARTGAC